MLQGRDDLADHLFEIARITRPSRPCSQEDQIVLMPITGCNCRLRADGHDCNAPEAFRHGKAQVACVPHTTLRFLAHACPPHDMNTLYDHHWLPDGCTSRISSRHHVFRKHSCIRTFFPTRLRSYRFSQRTVFYGLIALVLIIFPPIPRRTSRRGGRTRVVNQPVDVPAGMARQSKRLVRPTQHGR